MWDFIHTNNNLYSILSVMNRLYAVYHFCVVYLYNMMSFIIVYCVCIYVMLCMFILYSVSVYYLSTVCCYVFLWHHYISRHLLSVCVCEDATNNLAKLEVSAYATSGIVGRILQVEEAENGNNILTYCHL